MDEKTTETPLIELLRNIPPEARYEWQVSKFHHAMSPIGDLCHRAADRITELEDALKSKDGITVVRLSADLVCADIMNMQRKITELEKEKRWWKETALRQNAGLSPTSYKEAE